MCVPRKKDREKQQKTAAPPTPPQNVVKECPEKKKHTLIRLEVKGAVQKSATAYWEVQHDTLTIEVKAVTAPDDASAWQELVWNVGGQNADNNIVQVSRGGPMQTRVTAHLPDQPEKFVDIEIYDLTDITCPLPLKLGDRDRHWKAYEQNTNTTLTAVTVLDQSSVWSLLTWNPGGNANKSDVRLSSAGDKHVTVTLGQTGPKTLAADIHVCKWPRLEVVELLFDSYPVFNDGATEIDKQFDVKWKQGRPDPAMNVATASCQSILCYDCGGTIAITAGFKVTQAPTDPEKVRVKGVASIGGTTIEWIDQIDVDPSAKSVASVNMGGSVNIPKGVACLDPMEIKWYQTEPDDKTWTQIGTTKHLVYITLMPPQEKPYWTLLDISCRAGAGKTTEADFVPAAFQPFKSHTGDGNGFKRKSDGVALSYYLQGVNTSGDQTEPSVYSTFGILSRPDGTGRCGGWANLLIHMLEIHGVTGLGKLWFIRGKNPNSPNMKLRFLVKNCAFSGSGSKPAPYPYLGNTECVKQNGIPGQGKTNPQFDFGDHVVVTYGGKIYDPSYGVGPKSSALEYERDGIAGLGTMAWAPPYASFTMGDGTPQFISGLCSLGFVTHTVSGGEKLADVASKYGTSESALFNHPYNDGLKKKRVTADKIVDGDVVYIPRNSTTQMLDAHAI
jgi:hypothetical protein